MATLQQKIDQLRLRLRTFYATHGTGRLLTFIAAVVLISFFCDLLFHLPVEVRAVILLGFVGGVGAVVYRFLFRPLTTNMSDDDMVLYYESAHPDSEHRLISALQLKRTLDKPDYPWSRELTQTVVAEAEAYAGKLDASRLGTTPELRKGFATGGGLTAVVLLVALIAPTYFGIWLQRFFLGEAEWPRRTTLVVEYQLDGSDAWKRWDLKSPVSVVRGDGLALRAVAKKGGADHVWLNYVTSGKVAASIKINPDIENDSQFPYRFEQVIDPITFNLKGDDHTIEGYRLEVRIPPRLNNVELGYRLPAYTRPDPRDEKQRHQTGNVDTIPGTMVLFFGETNVPVRRAWLEIAQEDSEPATAELKVEEGRKLSGSFKVLRRGEYRVKMISSTGLKNREESAFSIGVRPDRNPMISISRPGREMKVLADSKMPIEVRAEDDFGIDRIHLRYAVVSKTSGQGEEKEIEVTLPGPAGGAPREVTATHLFDLTPLELKEGDEVVYFARAIDLNDVAESPGLGESSRYKFEVVSRAKLEEEIHELGKEVLAELEQLREHQRRTMSDTLELGDRVKNAGTYDDQHTKRLFTVALFQQQVSSAGAEISLKLVKMIEDIRTFELAQMRVVHLLEEADTLVRAVAEAKSPSAHKAIRAAPSRGKTPEELLVKAGALQQEIIDDLTGAIAKLDEFSDISRIVRGIKGVRSKEKEVEDALLEKVKRQRRKED